MHTCKPEEADVIVDGKPYRIESLQALRIVENRLCGKKGACFPTPQATRDRLNAEKKERERREKAMRKTQSHLKTGEKA